MAERSKASNGSARSGSGSKSRSGGSKATNGRSGAGSRTRKAPAKAAERTPMLDDRAKRDLLGVAISVVGVAMMIAVTSESTGVAAEWIASALRALVGLGAYVVPVVLVLWGISFFVRIGDISEGRIGAGLALIVVALTGMVSLQTPTPTSSAPSSRTMAATSALRSRGYFTRSSAPPSPTFC